MRRSKKSYISEFEIKYKYSDQGPRTMDGQHEVFGVIKFLYDLNLSSKSSSSEPQIDDMRIVSIHEKQSKLLAIRGHIFVLGCGFSK